MFYFLWGQGGGGGGGGGGELIVEGGKKCDENVRFLLRYLKQLIVATQNRKQSFFVWCYIPSRRQT